MQLVFYYAKKTPTLRRLPPKDEDIVNAETVVPNSYALDGAALLHQVKYLKGSTYVDLKLCVVCSPAL